MEIWTLIVQSNTFNFIILLLIIALIIKKCKINEHLTSAQQKVNKTIDESAQTKESSLKELVKANETVKNVQNEILEIEANGDKNIELLTEKIEKETQKGLENIEENLKKVIDFENKETISSLSKQTAIAAIELAKKHIKEILSNKPEYHQKFIDESIQELETGLK